MGFNSKGFVPVIVLVAVVGLVAFVLVSRTLNFKSALNNSLYGNKNSFASSPFNPGDADGDLDVDILDYNAIITNYGKTTFNNGDFNGDGKIDILDYNLLITNYGKKYASNPSSSSSPFPLYAAAKEKIPDFCTTGLVPGNGAIVNSKQSGNWSDPNTWSNGQVPGIGTQVNVGVQIPVGQTVTYDEVPTANPVVSCIKIFEGGSLKFANNIDTKLTVGTLVNFGYLEIGTETSPIQSGKRAEVVIADQPLMIDSTTPSNSKDPNQMGTGILVLKNGKLRIHGEVKSDDPNIYNQNTHAFIRLTSEPQAGATTLSLSENVLNYKWKVGDKIVLPDSREAHDWIQARAPSFVRQTERLIIQSISNDGKTITLASALKYAHPGAKDVAGNMTFLPHVGNLTRNVYVHSANPVGTRGHILASERADVDVRYAEFDAMGRTMAVSPLDNVTYDANNNVTHIGTNQIGRYTFHFHHDEGPVRTAAEQTDPNVFQAVFVGNAIDDSSKWGVTVHDTHYGLFKNNVVAGAVGAGIMLEQGNEYKDVIEGNFLVESNGMPNFSPGGMGDIRDRAGIGDFGWEGTGIWSMSPFSYFRNNVAAATKDSAFAFFMKSHADDYLGDTTKSRPNMNIPSKNYAIKSSYHVQSDPNFVQGTTLNQGVGAGQDIRGADIYDPNQTTLVDTGLQRLTEFKNNEAYGVTERGFNLWGSGSGSVIDTLKLWNIHYNAIQVSFPDYSGGTGLTEAPDALAFDFKNVIVRGDPNILNDPVVQSKWTNGFTAFMLHHWQYSTSYLIENADVQGMAVGINAPSRKLKVSNSYFRNYNNLLAFVGTSRFEREITYTNDTFDSLPGVTVPGKPQYDFNLTSQTLGAQTQEVREGPVGFRWNDITVPDVVRAYGYKTGGNLVGDVRLYRPEQAANFDIKQTDPWTQSTAEFPSITNQNSLNQYGSVIEDAIAPCNSTIAQVLGFVCPLSNPATAVGPKVYKNSAGSCPYVVTTSQLNCAYFVNGVALNKTVQLPIVGYNYLTFTDADVPANQQLNALDMNKNGVVDANEKFKKTFVIQRQ